MRGDPRSTSPATPDSVDEIEFRFYDQDPSARALALENGDVQVVGELLPVDARALTASSERPASTDVDSRSAAPILDEYETVPDRQPEVRQALLYGTNREAIIDAVFQRFSPVAWGPLAAVTEFYSGDVRGAYAYDPTQARSLLQAARLSGYRQRRLRRFRRR